ncbi:MAG: MBL fold metallo-hydrolase [Bacillota bacterium]
MELHVLVDNNTLIDRYFKAEPGVSYYIKDNGINILFDVGYSNIFIENANKMELDLYNLDYLVISHGHLDHTWGLVNYIKYLTEASIEGINYKKTEFITHPLALKEKMINQDVIGSLVKEERIDKFFSKKLTKKPYWLTDKLVFLGQIERNNDFEAKNPIGTYNDNGTFKKDYVLDDSALVYKAKKGLVIITGCSHAGICNIIEYAKKVCNEDKILDVIGGFHLLNPDDYQLKNTLKYFDSLNLKNIHACHCTDLKSKIELSKVVNISEVGVGLTLNYD